MYAVALVPKDVALVGFVGLVIAFVDALTVDEAIEGVIVGTPSK